MDRSSVFYFISLFLYFHERLISINYRYTCVTYKSPLRWQNTCRCMRENQAKTWLDRKIHRNTVLFSAKVLIRENSMSACGQSIFRCQHACKSHYCSCNKQALVWHSITILWCTLFIRPKRTVNTPSTQQKQIDVKYFWIEKNNSQFIDFFITSRDFRRVLEYGILQWTYFIGATGLVRRLARISGVI